VADRFFQYSAQTSRKHTPSGPLLPHLKYTGVPNKYYRGAQQVLPGCPTKITGVSDKNYRGPQQVLPGSSTKTTGAPNKSPSLKVLQNGVFYGAFFGSFVLVRLVVLCC